ncbi:MAG: GlmU family protein [Weeksellaceae bacterium]
MNIIFFDGPEWETLRPFTLTKPVAELRIGILKFAERWQKLLKGNYSFLTQDYLANKYKVEAESQNLFINSVFFPNGELVQSIQNLREGESIWYKESLVAANTGLNAFQSKRFKEKQSIQSTIIQIQHLWDLFTYNPFAIQYDFDLLTEGRQSQAISETNRIIHPERVFLEEGAVVEHAILNATDGPIYVGVEAEIMEGSMIRGGLALCEHGKINMGAKIYPGTTIGPHSKVGGEVNNSILMGYSNKGHDGFLGNSVLGEWCNLGADTNNSNLKNNYSNIRLWDYSTKSYIDTGLQFCGLMMGDFSKSAINTQFNTGTVVGVSANVFDPGFPPKFIPSFSWGGKKDSEKFDLEKSFDAAEKMMVRRKKLLTEKDKYILNHIFSESSLN